MVATIMIFGCQSVLSDFSPHKMRKRLMLFFLIPVANIVKKKKKTFYVTL